MSQLAGQVELDPGLTVRILRLVNSAAFGLSSQVSNLQHAISLLGRSRLESLVLALAAAEQVPDQMGCLERKDFWGAAALRATLARALAQELHAATEAESFTAGLLQDMAVPLLANSNPNGYGEILARWHEDPELQLDTLEQELFGYDHATIGALMAEDWGLPEYLIRAIAGHHESNGNGEVDPAVRLVSLVTYAPENDGRTVVSARAESGFGIEGSVMAEIMDRSLSEAQEVAGMFLD
jgi:HD-like signal output (HDOD) protein